MANGGGGGKGGWNNKKDGKPLLMPLPRIESKYTHTLIQKTNDLIIP